MPKQNKKKKRICRQVLELPSQRLMCPAANYDFVKRSRKKPNPEP